MSKTRAGSGGENHAAGARQPWPSWAPLGAGGGFREVVPGWAQAEGQVGGGQGVYVHSWLWSCFLKAGAVAPGCLGLMVSAPWAGGPSLLLPCRSLPGATYRDLLAPGSV